MYLARWGFGFRIIVAISSTISGASSGGAKGLGGGPIHSVSTPIYSVCGLSDGGVLEPLLAARGRIRNIASIRQTQAMQHETLQQLKGQEWTVRVSRHGGGMLPACRWHRPAGPLRPT